MLLVSVLKKVKAMLYIYHLTFIPFPKTKVTTFKNNPPSKFVN